MTDVGQALAEALAEAARVMPERFRWVGKNVAHVQWLDYRRNVYYADPETHSWVELACREECAVRGWEWAIKQAFYGPSAEVWPDPSRDSYWADADSPALALLRALLAAATAEAGGGEK